MDKNIGFFIFLNYFIRILLFQKFIYSYPLFFEEVS